MYFYCLCMLKSAFLSSLLQTERETDRQRKRERERKRERVSEWVSEKETDLSVRSSRCCPKAKTLYLSRLAHEYRRPRFIREQKLQMEVHVDRAAACWMMSSEQKRKNTCTVDGQFFATALMNNPEECLLHIVHSITLQKSACTHTHTEFICYRDHLTQHLIKARHCIWSRQLYV